jgi:diguanylate cyclase (GGDEF)-like protein
MTVIGDAVIIAGIVLLFLSFIPVRMLIRHLPPGATRESWSFLVGIIGLFIAGYITYAALRWQSHETIADMLVPAIFFLTAVFILLVSYLSLQTALSLQRISRLERESITDPLTGMYNRRHMDRRLVEEVERARRYGYPLSIMLFDIDHFKKINDQHGHQLGDVVLKNLSRILSGAVRRTDIVARYGGEEILIITPHTELEEAYELADRIRVLVQDSEVADIRTHEGRQPIHVTTSGGVAEDHKDMESTRILIELADEALYKAKSEGRNCVIQAKNSEDSS